MPTVVSLRLPFETGTRLHNLALTLGTTVTDTVALLLDNAARGGLGTLALPGIDIGVENCAVTVKFNDLATKPLSRADAKAFAHRIRTVSSVLFVNNMDCPDWIKVSRLGRAIVVEIAAANGSTIRKTLTRGTASSVADRLDEAAAGIALPPNPASTPRTTLEIPADGDNVDHSLGYLDPGEDIVLADNESVDALLADLDLGDEASAT
jgi:hypothetical protein